MSVSYPDMVQDCLVKLKDLTCLRDEVSEELERTWGLSYVVDDDLDRVKFVAQAERLQKKIRDITSEGEQYILKIDRLNGVR